MLTISPLAEGQDDGQYTSSVIVSGRSSVLDATLSDSTIIDVTCKYSTPMSYSYITHIVVTHKKCYSSPCNEFDT